MKKIWSLLPFLLVSCLQDLPDCEGKKDVLSNDWIIKEIFIDEVKQESASYQGYRLHLDPTGTYQRNQPAGFPDAGAWSLTNGETVLVLQPSISPEEQYLIDSFTLRELVLVLNRSSTKSGPSKIRFVLIPEQL